MYDENSNQDKYDQIQDIDIRVNPDAIMKPELNKNNNDLLVGLDQEIKRGIQLINETLELFENIFKTLSDNDKLYKVLLITRNNLKIVKENYTDLITIFEHLIKISIAKDNDHENDESNIPILNKANNPATMEYYPCLSMLKLGIDYVNNKIVKELLNVAKDIQKSPKNRLLLTNEAIIISSKLEMAKDFIEFSAKHDKNDIFALSQDHEIWKKLHEIVEIKALGKPEKLRKSINQMVKQIQLSNAMVEASYSKTKSKFKRKAYLAFNGVYYFCASSSAKKKAELAIAQPKDENIIKVWNLMESPFIKNMMKISLPSIKVCQKIYIPRDYPPITHNLILNEVNTNTINIITPNPKILPVQTSFTKKKDLNKIKIRILSDKKLPELKAPNHVVVNLPQDQEAHQIKINNPELLKADRPVSQKVKSKGCCASFKECLSGKSKAPLPSLDPYFDGIVIHIHGGGFIAMSSSTHQSYTRQWAKLLQKPIFSIDYRLAPAHPFPTALDDCWQAYNWIIDNSEAYLGIKPSKVILAGDSAGGNLILSIALRAIKVGYRVPHGLLLAYPALNLSIKQFSPSLILAMDDTIVPYTMLKFCVDAYVSKDFSPETNPFISPLLASDELLMNLPPIRIVVGNKDPLHDDCWRLVHRLMNLQKNVRMTVYEEFPHGFLSYDVPSGVSESRICIKEAANYIKEMMEMR